jgi:hypothetical protein
LVSVIVATPTSKLRLACASCSDTARFCASASSTLNCASSTSKYATATRMIRSCCAEASVKSACSTWRRACSRATTFW